MTTTESVRRTPVRLPVAGLVPAAAGPFVSAVIPVIGLAVALVAGVPATVRAR